MRRTLRHDESGAVLVLVALLLPVLLGMVGVALDSAHLFMNRRQMQGIADLAALAGAYRLSDGELQARKAARDLAAANGFPHGTGSRAVVVTTPYESEKNLIAVELRDSVPALFVRVLGIERTPVRVRAVARANPGRPIIWAGSTSCATRSSERAFYWGGSNSTVQIPLHSNGHMEVGGNYNVFEAPVTYACSFNSNDKNTFKTPPQQVPVQPLPVSVDPKGWTCDFHSTKDFHLKDPGPWWESYSTSPRVLKPGVYCSDAKLTLKIGDVAGRVTFYAKDTMEIAGTNLRLDAFVDNVLFYSAASGDALVVSGSGGRLSGYMLAPSGMLKFTGNDNIVLNGSMFGHRINVAGQLFTMTAPKGGKGRLVN